MAKLTAQTLAEAKAGQEIAIAAVLANMMPLLRRTAAIGVCPGLEFDDAMQEGIIGLFRAIKRYDAEKDASFETYACVCVQNAVLTARRSAGRNKHDPLNKSVPLLDTYSSPGPEEIAIQQENLALTLQTIQTYLSEFERDVLTSFLEGGSYNQIAQQLGRTPKAVENALFRLRRKLREVDFQG